MNTPPTKPITRRTALRTLSALGAGATLALSGCAPPRAHSHTTPTTELTIGYVPIACTTSLILADAHQHFAAAGLKVRLRKFAGWSELWSAYVTQDIDVAHMLSPMPIAINSGATGGRRETTIAATLNTNGQAFVLANKHRHTVRKLEDVRGFSLGIPFDYSVHALLLRDALATAGLDPDRDVNLRLLRPADMVAQLATGTIDGFVGPEPLTQRAIDQGFGRAFALTKQWWDNHPCCCIAVATELTDSHPHLVGNVRNALTAATAHLPEATTPHILARENYLNQPEQFIASALAGRYINWSGQLVVDPERMRFDSDTDAAAVTWMAAQLARWDLGIAPKEADIISAAHKVLPANTPSSSTLHISGQPFNPRQPLSTYQLNPT
ncbi:ABC transporter substrate-binding protein [Corynebacterium aquilae]|uniref:Nitrate ABC transporter substrate-binding protein n=1 Tax=Corynebacterium aquilae DSM 44791 TaxID=1431546 RepID=A0A1L7CGS4_9CORY|nr:ABC transporter substrate-binding protein [Corynebacterium aquilae]APT85025.1 hypothetical protein CAQU_08010 [Corynebacterium aquilae DSM 44791]